MTENISKRLSILCLAPLLPIAFLKFHVWQTSPIKLYGLNQPKVTIISLFALVFIIAIAPDKYFKWIPKINQWVGLVALCIFIIVMDKKLVLHSHADKFALYKNPFLLVIAILITILFIFKFQNSKLHGSLRVMSITVGTLWSIYLASYLLIDERHPYLYNWVNLQLVIHPIIQTDLGKTTFIDMNSQYGGYALILDPIFEVIGISLFKITFVFALIFLVSLLSIYFILYKVCKDKLLALLGFLGTTYLMMYAFFMWPFEKYYQVYPIRLFFPILSALLVLYSSRFKQKTFLILAALLNMLSIYWNPETGTTMTIALLCFVCIKWGGNDWRKVAKIAFTFISSLGVFVVLFKLMIDLTNPGSLSFHMMFRSMFLYLSGTEINSLKIWSLVLFVYGLSLILALAERRKNQAIEKATLDILLYLGFLGMGLLVYHLNNMNEASLGCVIWPCSILLTLIVDLQFEESDVHSKFLRGKKFSKAKLTKLKSPPKSLSKFGMNYLLLVFTIYLAICAVAIQFSQTVKDEERIWELSDIRSQKQLFNDIDSNDDPMFVTVAEQIRGRLSTPVARINFIKTIATPKVQKKLLILSQWDSILYLHANALCPVSWPNWYIAYFDYEYQETYKKLLDGSITRVVIDEIPGALGEPLKLHAPGLDEKMLEIIRSRFTLVKRVELPKAYSGYVKGNWAQTYISLYELR